MGEETNINKQYICKMLRDTLQETDMMAELISLTYEKDPGRDDERVVAKFQKGSDIIINVTMDNEFSMIKDIVNHI